jgi:hypothetical protein
MSEQSDAAMREQIYELLQEIKRELDSCLASAERSLVILNRIEWSTHEAEQRPKQRR